MPDDKIARIIEAARLAPSGNNLQPWKFIVVKDPVKRRALGQTSDGQDFIGTATVIIAAIANDLEWLMPCGVPGYGVDLAITAEHIVLSAANEGLGVAGSTISQRKGRRKFSPSLNYSGSLRYYRLDTRRGKVTVWNGKLWMKSLASTRLSNDVAPRRVAGK